MSDQKLHSLSAFEWASVAQYIVYISGAACLREINSDHVNCLPLARIGPTALLARKMRVSTELKANKRQLEYFVKAHQDQLDEKEISVIRGMYRQYKDNLETVNGHMDIIESYAQASDKSLFEQTEVIDDTPF